MTRDIGATHEIAYDVGETSSMHYGSRMEHFHPSGDLLGQVFLDLT
ncbi:hypothetical protein RUMLAC_00283, partial [[Ruminococcus] lactaris ATCC 29176]